MIYFAAIEGTCQINWPFELSGFSGELIFNGASNNDNPDDPPSLDNGNSNPFDHAYHGEEE